MSDVDEKESRKTSSSFRDVRPAEPGEFSKRAFLNKKMNLVQAESLADLIEAETEAQRALAVSEIEIDDEELADVKTVGQAVNLLHSKI